MEEDQLTSPVKNKKSKEYDQSDTKEKTKRKTNDGYIDDNELCLCRKMMN